MTQAHRQFSVYVAGAATPDAVARVDAAISALRAQGFVVTCTWPGIVAATPGGANPRDASVESRRAWTTQDLNEIDAADALWFLVPELPSTTRGGWFEAGYAYSNHKHIVFSGDTKQSVFCALGIEFENDEGALAFLRGLRDRTRVETGLTELRRQTNWPDDAAFGPTGNEAADIHQWREVTPLPPAPDPMALRLQDLAHKIDEHGARVVELRNEVAAQSATSAT